MMGVVGVAAGCFGGRIGRPLPEWFGGHAHRKHYSLLFQTLPAVLKPSITHVNLLFKVRGSE